MECPVICNGCGEVVELRDCRGPRMLCSECRAEEEDALEAEEEDDF